MSDSIDDFSRRIDQNLEWVGNPWSSLESGLKASQMLGDDALTLNNLCILCIELCHGSKAI